MKLLFDQNLPLSLKWRLTDLGADGFAHVNDFGFEAVDDELIWELAKRERFTIVTKDKDFRMRSALLGGPPKVILLKIGNCPLAAVQDCLRRAWPFVRKLHDEPSANLLMLTRDAAFLLHDHRG